MSELVSRWFEAGNKTKEEPFKGIPFWALCGPSGLYEALRGLIGALKGLIRLLRPF